MGGKVQLRTLETALKIKGSPCSADAGFVPTNVFLQRFFEEKNICFGNAGCWLPMCTPTVPRHVTTNAARFDWIGSVTCPPYHPWRKSSNVVIHSNRNAPGVLGSPRCCIFSDALRVQPGHTPTLVTRRDRRSFLISVPHIPTFRLGTWSVVI